MSEVVKLVTCLAVVYIESGGVVQLLENLDRTIIKSPMDTLKVCVPSFVYVVQNNLLYISASHLDAATYQVSRLKLNREEGDVSYVVYVMTTSYHLFCI